ncbi:hypothetical protein Ddc_10500 [Ditylenchus destructor]|nr:hypothetical protein Ddc_10500 [Ditylenchus destructor]
MNSFILHVSTHHCDRPIYECLACNKQWFSISARLKEHFKAHNDDMSFLKDNRSAMMPMLKEKAAELFSSYCPNLYKEKATVREKQQQELTLPYFH